MVTRTGAYGNESLALFGHRYLGLRLSLSIAVLCGTAPLADV